MAYLAARLKLLGIEAGEALARVAAAFLLMLAGAVALAFAHALMMLGLTLLWVRQFGGHWIAPAMALGLIHAGLGCWLLARARRSLQTLNCFEESRRQLQEDESALNGEEPDAP